MGQLRAAAERVLAPGGVTSAAFDELRAAVAAAKDYCRCHLEDEGEIDECVDDDCGCPCGRHRGDDDG